MSIVAEFAAELHRADARNHARELHPLSYPSPSEIVRDVRVLIFDVYGTLFNYWKNEFGDKATKKQALLNSFKSTIDYFGIEPYLLDMDKEHPAENTLWDLYHGLITLKQNLLIEKDINYPEVRIDEVWTAILLMLKRHGYTYSGKDLGPDSELVRCIAFYYNFHAFNRGLYPGVTNALVAFKQKNMRLGILSNAQFYTSIDLTLFLRDQSNNAIEDLGELFEHDLMYYSYEYSMAKPSQALFRKLFDALYEFQVLPSQTVFVGNDLAADIKPAQDAGMKTALYVGDDKSAFLNGLRSAVIPDITFSTWNELTERVSFYEK